MRWRRPKLDIFCEYCGEQADSKSPDYDTWKAGHGIHCKLAPINLETRISALEKHWGDQ